MDDPVPVSPYHQHSALYPMIDLLERVVLRFDREEPLPQKLRKLEGFWCGLAATGEAMPLLLPSSPSHCPLSMPL